VLTGTTNGNVISDNLQQLSWTSIEEGISIDAAEPAPSDATYRFDDPIPTLAVAFGEDLTDFLNIGFFTLTNTTTSQVIANGDLGFAFEPATNSAIISAPGLPGGYLPDGDYTITVEPGYSDFAGNVATVAASFSFFVLAGDANRSRTVDIGDFAILVSNFNLPGTFSQGDFNYSGVTDIGDFAILVASFNVGLPGPLPSPARTAAVGNAQPPVRLGAERSSVPQSATNLFSEEPVADRVI
jgi:hypothetical protein